MRQITAGANQGLKTKNAPGKYTQAMQGHLAAVAVGSARTELSANIRLMARFFEQGVPADDDTCVRMMRALLSCGECGEIDLDISDVFKLELVALPAGSARDLDEDNGRNFPQCDAYGEDEEALEADFSEKTATGDRRVGVIRARATPGGFRQFIRNVRSAARALNDSGLCPRCPNQATASMRLPRSNFCAECCFAVAILGDKQ